MSDVSEASRKFGSSIRAEMDKRGMSYDHLVAITGIPKGNVHRYITGQNEIPLKHAVTLANQFGMKVDDLVGGVKSER